MDTKQPPVTKFWWLKTATTTPNLTTTTKQSEREISSSLAEYLEHEQEAEELDDDVDIPSILEEISRLSAKSPLGQYQKDIGTLSIEEIMREAEKIYMESSKSFEQLSQRSKISNLSDLSESLKSDHSTPTPKSVSPLPLDDKSPNDQNSSTDSDTESLKVPEVQVEEEVEEQGKSESLKLTNGETYSSDFEVSNEKTSVIVNLEETQGVKELNYETEEDLKQQEIIKMLLSNNKGLKEELRVTVQELNDLKQQPQRTTSNTELTNALELLKDTQEQKTALQLQLEEANKSQAELRTTCDDLLNANNILERRVIDLDSVLTKYKSDLKAIQSIRDKLKENEFNVNKLLEHERVQVKQFKQQVEKDSKCILDLNRQIKEMERIIARKHPDSVSALIVASKYDDNGTRKMFEERIKTLEQEALMRDAQSSKVFKDVQEKFNQMKLKYESHIEDLELHVNDLKSQLKRKGDTYDVYTQTKQYDEKIPAKDTTNTGSQTDFVHNERNQKIAKKPEVKEVKEDAHLLATIRGYQSELAAKDKTIIKIQKELDELRKTNRRLQKEREGSLRTNFTTEKKSSEKLCVRETTPPPAVAPSSGIEEDEQIIRIERDKLKAQLTRLESEFQALKAKRLQDLNTLQEAHEREMSNYLANITPLREKLEVQTVTLTSLQQQLMAAKEELAVVTVERDHLNNKLNCGVTSLLQGCNFENGNSNENENEAISLRKKLNVLELKYEERENRLRAIVHGLAQKTITNRTCEQCAERQQQLVGYKVELDQIIATLRCLQ